MSAFESIVPAELGLLHSQRGHSPGARVGPLLLISGMLGRDQDLVVVTEPQAQLTRLFENLGLVLTEAGCGWTDVVELTAYFTNLRRDFDLFMTVRDRFIQAPYPAMTMVGVAELAQPGLICEVKGLAVLPGARVAERNEL